jgi:hypothetical protein
MMAAGIRLQGVIGDGNNLIFEIELNPPVRRIGSVPIIVPVIIDDIPALIVFRRRTRDINNTLRVNIPTESLPK